MGKKIDMTGWKMWEHGVPESRLEVIGDSGKRGNGGIYWNCICKCGNSVCVSGSALRTGNTKSCGCLDKEKTIDRNLKRSNIQIGQKYNYLTVIEDLGFRYPTENSKKRRRYFLCQCDCGNIVEVSRRHLKDGHTRSCGCMVSFGEDYVVQFLSELNYNVKRQYKIEKLKDKNELPFDIAILDSKNKLIGLIEVQGKQHFDSSLLFYSEDLIKHDKMKYEYCLNNKIPLLLLDYRNGKEKTNFLEWNNLINKFLEENNGLLSK